MKKIISIGLLGGLMLLTVGLVMGQLFQILDPSLKSEFENANLFRSWSDPAMMLFFVHPFLQGIILAWVWTRIKEILQMHSDLKRGIYFGLAVWLACTFPGMFISYSSFPISLMMILSWTISGLVELVFLGIFFSKTLK